MVVRYYIRKLYRDALSRILSMPHHVKYLTVNIAHRIPNEPSTAVSAHRIVENYLEPVNSVSQMLEFRRKNNGTGRHTNRTAARSDQELARTVRIVAYSKCAKPRTGLFGLL